MTILKYLIDTSALSRIGRKKRASTFVWNNCKIPSEVLREAAIFPDIAMLRTLEYPMSADVLNLLRKVMSTVQPGDKDLIDLYHVRGNADPILVATALDGIAKSEETFVLRDATRCTTRSTAIHARPAIIARMTFGEWREPAELGFEVVAGPSDGLSRLLVISGLLPAADYGHVHLHGGEEILIVRRGELDVRVGEERRACGVGDVVVIPPDTPHGFHTHTEAVLEVIAEQGMSTYYPTRGPDGVRRYVAAFRPNLPWSPAPPDGVWTSDDDYEAILAAIDLAV